MSLQQPLVTELSIVPAGQGRLFKGPDSGSPERSVKDWCVAQRTDNRHRQLAPCLPADLEVLRELGYAPRRWLAGAI